MTEQQIFQTLMSNVKFTNWLHRNIDKLEQGYIPTIDEFKDVVPEQFHKILLSAFKRDFGAGGGYV